MAESELVKEVRAYLEANRAFESARTRESHWATRAREALDRRAGAMFRMESLAEDFGLPGAVQFDNICVRLELDKDGNVLVTEMPLLGVAESPDPEESEKRKEPR